MSWKCLAITPFGHFNRNYFYALLLCAVGQRPYLRCVALDAQVRKEGVIWVSDNQKNMRLSGLEMKYRGV
jgi:hypothetical protein